MNKFIAIAASQKTQNLLELVGSKGLKLRIVVVPADSFLVQESTQFYSLPKPQDICDEFFAISVPILTRIKKKGSFKR